MSASTFSAPPYRIVRRLGGGSMSDVYEAEHTNVARNVVLKVLRADLADRKELFDRMRLEAQALAKLAHENLVEVSDFGTTSDGRPYLVMERLTGRTLADELAERGRLAPAEAIDCVVQALHGLSAAHAMGLVHRDVKPANLFLCDTGVVKVLDFGVAKSTGSAVAPLAAPTGEGLLVGTPRFASPEQITGRGVDARSDVYAAGAVLYALVTGRGPFDHKKTTAEITAAQLAETPRPPSVLAEQPIPSALDALVMKALAKRPEERFATAEEMASELERIAAHPGPMAIVERAGKTAVASPRAPHRQAPIAPPRSRVPPLVLAGAILDLCYRAFAVVRAAMLIANPLAFQSPTLRVPKGSATARALDEAAMRFATADVPRNLALAALSAALVVIALRLRRQDPRARGQARTWTTIAFASLAVSFAIELLVTVPSYVAIAAAAAAIDTTSSIPVTVASTVAYAFTIVTTALIAIALIALRRWTTR